MWNYFKKTFGNVKLFLKNLRECEIILSLTLPRAVSLDGAVEGLMFFFQPVWAEVLDPKVGDFRIEEKVPNCRLYCRDNI